MFWSEITQFLVR